MSPLSIVHVRKDFEVTRIDAGQSAHGEKEGKSQSGFD
jgi:hypothetical protein